jgi:hypothetical protein
MYREEEKKTVELTLQISSVLLVDVKFVGHLFTTKRTEIYLRDHHNVWVEGG